MSEDFRARLVLAALDAIRPGDPTLIIGVGESEVRLGWDMGFDEAD